MNSVPEAATALRLLADPLRRRIVQHLAAEQLCTCHLVELTGAGQTLISHHLRALREAGMVESSPYGRFTYYRLRAGSLEAAAGTLAALAEASRGDVPRRPCP